MATKTTRQIVLACAVAIALSGGVATFQTMQASLNGEILSFPSMPFFGGNDKPPPPPPFQPPPPGPFKGEHKMPTYSDKTFEVDCPEGFKRVCTSGMIDEAGKDHGRCSCVPFDEKVEGYPKKPMPPPGRPPMHEMPIEQKMCRIDFCAGITNPEECMAPVAVVPCDSEKCIESIHCEPMGPDNRPPPPPAPPHQPPPPPTTVSPPLPSHKDDWIDNEKGRWEELDRKERELNDRIQKFEEMRSKYQPGDGSKCERFDYMHGEEPGMMPPRGPGIMPYPEGPDFKPHPGPDVMPGPGGPISSPPRWHENLPMFVGRALMRMGETLLYIEDGDIRAPAIQYIELMIRELQGRLNQFDLTPEELKEMEEELHDRLEHIHKLEKEKYRDKKPRMEGPDFDDSPLKIFEMFLENIDDLKEILEEEGRSMPDAANDAHFAAIQQYAQAEIVCDDGREKEECRDAVEGLKLSIITIHSAMKDEIEKLSPEAQEKIMKLFQGR